MRPYTPITTVAAQMVLTVEDTAESPGDPGDAVRALLYPGEVVWGAWDAYVCATSDKICTATEASWVPDWHTFVKVSELKGIDKRITRVFTKKKPQIIAGSFFALGGAVAGATRGGDHHMLTDGGTACVTLIQLVPRDLSADFHAASPELDVCLATCETFTTGSVRSVRRNALVRALTLRRGNAGTLGIFSVVMMVWPLLSSPDATPLWGLLVYVALAWQTMSISRARHAAAAKRRKRRAGNAAAEAPSGLREPSGETSGESATPERKKDK